MTEPAIEYSFQGSNVMVAMQGKSVTLSNYIALLQHFRENYQWVSITELLWHFKATIFGEDCGTRPSPFNIWLGNYQIQFIVNKTRIERDQQSTVNINIYCLKAKVEIGWHEY